MITAWSTLSVKAAGMVVPAVWIGMLIGFSFIATPSKFAAHLCDLQSRRVGGALVDVDCLGLAVFDIWIGAGRGPHRDPRGADNLAAPGS